LKKKSLNITAFEEDLNAAIEAQPIEINIEVEPIAIDKDLFQSAWQMYIKVLTDEGSAGMATSFVDIDCRIDFNNIILEISSSSIEELIKKDKSRLIEFFRKHLQNESVSIETQMIENTTKKNIKSLSPKERLNEMINQNPEVLRLMKDLGLELDY
jgi:hypothetical protein